MLQNHFDQCDNKTTLQKSVKKYSVCYTTEKVSVIFATLPTGTREIQSNLYKTTSLGTIQKWLSWTDGCLIKHLSKVTTNQIWSFLAGYYHCEYFINNGDLLE